MTANPIQSRIAGVPDEPAFHKHSVTLPAATSEALRERVGARGVSAYVAEAVARQLRRDALREWIEEAEAKYGPVDEAEVQAAMRKLRGE